MCTLSLEFGEFFLKLLDCGGSETGNLDVSYSRTDHISGIYSVHGNLVSDYHKVNQFFYTTAVYAQIHLGTLWTTQTFHYGLLGHLHSGYGSIVYGNDTVTCQYTHLLGRAVGYGLYYEKRILNHIELDADALE